MRAFSSHPLYIGVGGMLPDQLVESEGVAELLVLVEDLLDGQLVVGQDLQGRLVVTVVILLRLEAGVECLQIPSRTLGFLPKFHVQYCILGDKIPRTVGFINCFLQVPVQFQAFCPAAKVS